MRLPDENRLLTLRGLFYFFIGGKEGMSGKGSCREGVGGMTDLEGFTMRTMVSG